MTSADEPAPRGRAAVTDLDEARRRRGPAREEAEAGAAGRRSAKATAAKRRRDPANRRFDAVKVDRLKREIAAGRYEVDHWSVADRFIEHERNRG